MKKTPMRLSSDDQLILAALLDAIGCRTPTHFAPKFPRNLRHLFNLGRRYGLAYWVLNSLRQRYDGVHDLINAYATIAECSLRAQTNAWNIVAEAFDRKGIIPLVFKGFVSKATLYKQEEPFILNDIDILVRPVDLPKAKTALKKSGFTQNLVSNDGRLEFVTQQTILQYEQEHYELFPYTILVREPQLDEHVPILSGFNFGHPLVIDGKKVFVAVEVDLHHNLSIGIDQKDIWHSSRSIEMNDRTIKTLAPETAIWFHFSRFYHETMIFGSQNLRNLVDVARLICGSTVSWDYVTKISDKYALGPGLFYVGTFLHDYCGVTIPKAAVAELEQQTQNGQQFHNFGDFAPKLFRKRIIFDLT